MVSSSRSSRENAIELGKSRVGFRTHGLANLMDSAERNSEVGCKSVGAANFVDGRESARRGHQRVKGRFVETRGSASE
jgi:hypothetical protein